jgi:hypothetical protein
MSQEMQSAKEQVVSDVKRCIQVLEMFKTTHDGTFLAHFSEVIKALGLVVEDFESGVPESRTGRNK